MKQCTKCKKYLSTNSFGVKSWINKDGSKTTAQKSRCRTCTNKDNLERYHKNPKTKEAYKTASYRYRIKSYGLTEHEYLKMLTDQNYSCAICHTKPEKTLVIDHCHSSGRIRGLLCDHCNKALGYAKDDINILSKMIKYLE